MNNYQSNFDLEQKRLDLKRQLQNSESNEESQKIMDFIEYITKRINESLKKYA